MGFMWWRSARGERGGSSCFVSRAGPDQSSNNIQKEFLRRNCRCFVSSWYRPVLGWVSEKSWEPVRVSSWFHLQYLRSRSRVIFFWNPFRGSHWLRTVCLKPLKRKNWYTNDHTNSINENHNRKLVTNVSHKRWWRYRHMTWLHVCTLYISYNIVVILVTHL